MCQLGTTSSIGSSDCTYTCPAGYYVLTSSVQCSACAPGRYSTSGDSACTACPVATYAAASGTGTCSNSPAGYYVSGLFCFELILRGPRVDLHLRDILCCSHRGQ